MFETIEFSVSAVAAALWGFCLLTAELLLLWLLFELVILRLVAAWTRFGLELPFEHMLLDCWVRDKFYDDC